MKRRKLLKIAIIAALLIAALTVTTVAANPHITRGEFFTSLGKTLGLTEEETANLSFSDYNNENKIVNALVNIKYLLGRNNGTLALGEELTIKDVDYIFSRIKWPEKIVTETKYVSGGTRYVTEEKLIDYSDITHDQSEQDHLFQLRASGLYECIFKDCTVVAPAGTSYIPIAESVPELTTVQRWLSEESDDLTNAEFYLDKPTAGLLLDLDSWPYQIASNALLFVKTNIGLTQKGLIEFFEENSVNELVAGETRSNPQHTGWYHTFTAGDPDGEDYVELVDVVIIDKTTEVE